MKVAFATDAAGQIVSQHFGAAAQFHLFEFSDAGAKPLGVRDNPHPGHGGHGHHHHHDHAHGEGHGHHGKGRALIEFFEEEGVALLVARQFGQNIRMVCEHFIPVLTGQTEVPRAVEEIMVNLSMFEEEWTAPAGERHLIFRIKGAEMIPIATKDPA